MDGEIVEFGQVGGIEGQDYQGLVGPDGRSRGKGKIHARADEPMRQVHRRGGGIVDFDVFVVFRILASADTGIVHDFGDQQRPDPRSIAAGVVRLAEGAVLHGIQVARAVGPAPKDSPFLAAPKST